MLTVGLTELFRTSLCKRAIGVLCLCCILFCFGSVCCTMEDTGYRCNEILL